VLKAHDHAELRHAKLTLLAVDLVPEADLPGADAGERSGGGLVEGQA
jgi:hypothetical protein